MINMEVNCEFNNFHCKEQNCLYHNRCFAYDKKLRNFMAVTDSCSFASVHCIIQFSVL